MYDLFNADKLGRFICILVCELCDIIIASLNLSVDLYSGETGRVITDQNEIESPDIPRYGERNESNLPSFIK